MRTLACCFIALPQDLKKKKKETETDKEHKNTYSPNTTE